MTQFVKGRSLTDTWKHLKAQVPRIVSHRILEEIQKV